MDPERVWQVIGSERCSLADLLEGLTDEQWEAASLCAGWRVRDVAAHVALAPQVPSAGTIVTEWLRARGSFDRLNHDIAVRHAGRSRDRIVAELREHAASRRHPFVTNERNLLLDILTHGQDIARPLGLVRPMPTDATAAAATRVWTMGWPFWARRRLRGFRLVATDVDWAFGAGPEVTGPIGDLLLLLTGRAAALAALDGQGVDRVAARMRVRSGHDDPASA